MHKLISDKLCYDYSKNVEKAHFVFVKSITKIL